MTIKSLIAKRIDAGITRRRAENAKSEVGEELSMTFIVLKPDRIIVMLPDFRESEVRHDEKDVIDAHFSTMAGKRTEPNQFIILLKRNGNA